MKYHVLLVRILIETISYLKPLICSFYRDDELFEAKESLLKAILQAGRDGGVKVDLPCLPRRHQENKMRLTADDLLKLFTVMDERKLCKSLPRFVAEDLTRTPSVNVDDINAATTSKKLEALEQRMRSVEHLLSCSAEQNDKTPYISTDGDTGKGEADIRRVPKKQYTELMVITLSILNRLSKFFTAGKRTKFQTKPIYYFPPYLQYPPALPCKI